MGLEPTTFCMASARDVRARSRPCAQTAWLQRLRPSERTEANASERRTLPFLPRVGSDRASLITGSARGPLWIDIYDRVPLRRGSAAVIAT
jgi:hypothetical protein